MEDKIYHIGTRGLEKDLWFWDDEDFIDGMNSVPVCAMETDVSVYCFCLMSNHVHFIAGGREENCMKFIREYKRRRSLQLSGKYKDERSIQGSEIFMNPIEDLKYMRTAVAYVMRNPMAAGIPVLPADYPWSSSNVYFADKSFREGCYRKMGGLSLTAKRKLLKSKTQLPDDYLIDYDGVVFPGSYVDYEFIEKIYASPKNMMYFLSSTNDMLMELETGVLAKASYKDSELLASVEIVCAEKFHGRTLGTLKIEERYLLAKEIRKPPC